MKRYFIIEKEIGETPLEALRRGRRKRRIHKDVPLAYAGRLDPMASGVLLVLVGDECKVQEKYHALQKEYVIEVLFGISSDTGDTLGLIQKANEKEITPKKIREVLRTFIGPYTSPYPLFSSKTVQGKPLFLWALEGRTDEIEIPCQNGHIYTMKLLRTYSLSIEKIIEIVKKNILKLTHTNEESKRLGANFRKEEVFRSWDTLPPHQKFYIAKIKVKTSSGVYMRTLAHDLAEKLGTDAITLSIHRTRIFL